MMKQIKSRFKKGISGIVTFFIVIYVERKIWKELKKEVND